MCCPVDEESRTNEHLWNGETLPVWPDVEMKSSQIVSKSCQKIGKASFYIKREFLKIAQIPIKMFWLLL